MALEPAALERALAAAEQVAQERADLDRLWHQRLERASYEAERAARQYRRVEPENRLVARQLERAGEEHVAAQQHREEESHRFTSQHPRVLSAPEREAIRHLAADIPALGTAPTTPIAHRKEIIRQVVERVLVEAHGRSERGTVCIAWVGGGHTEEELVREIARLSDLSYDPQLCARVRALTAAGLSAPAIAAQLPEEGDRPTRQSAHVSLVQVAELQRRLDRRPCPPRVRERPPVGPEEGWASDLATRLGLARATLHRGIQIGWVRARQEEGPLQRWMGWADSAEVAHLVQLRQRSLADTPRQPWIEMADGSEIRDATIVTTATSNGYGGV